MKQIKFYLDFDGTITQTDVVDMILDRFADKSWHDIEEEWSSGKIGSRECLSRQMALVKCSQSELSDLCEKVQVDPDFLSFVQTAVKLDIPLKIVSDGFDFVIRRVLERYFSKTPEILNQIPVFSNRLEWTPEGPKAVFLTEDLCRHGCANCKQEVIKSTAWVSDHIFFVGDGLSDRYAALLCNRVFAKKELLQFCRENDLAHDEYTTFQDVEKWVLKNYEALKTLFSIQLRAV